MGKSEAQFGQRELTPAQAKFVSALLSGLSIKQAAKSANVTERTSHNWMKLAHVKQAVDEGTAAIVGAARLRAEVFSAQAVSVLATLMLDTSTPPQVRVTAARTLAARVLEPSPVQATETPVAQGIDYSAWSAEDLGIIYPLILKYEQEKKQA